MSFPFLSFDLWFDSFQFICLIVFSFFFVLSRTLRFTHFQLKVWFVKQNNICLLRIIIHIEQFRVHDFWNSIQNWPIKLKHTFSSVACVHWIEWESSFTCMHVEVLKPQLLNLLNNYYFQFIHWFWWVENTLNGV